MNKKIWLVILSITNIYSLTYSNVPLGLFVPYDITIKLKRPAKNNIYVGALVEKSYNVKAYATDACEEKTELVNPLQMYEKQQNWISLYQGIDGNQNRTTPFTQLLDSIAGGPGGGVSNRENGLFTPTGTFSIGQVAFSAMCGVGHGICISTHIPLIFAELHSVHWEYSGNNTLFSGESIQKELIASFTQDALEQFDLDITGWKKNGLGDLTIMAEWQKDFPQRRKVLKNVIPNLRFGIAFPTGVKTNENVLMPIPFGADGSFSIPFGGGLGIQVGNHAEIGFNGQFWHFFGHQKERRVKTFATQTSLLLPTKTQTYKEYSFLQNFNLYAQAFSLCKRFSLKMCYHYWRRGDDTVTPSSSAFNFDIINNDARLLEETRHNVSLALNYSPKPGEFKKVIPQFQLFWKGAVKGMRSAIASTAGAQIALIF